MNDLDKIFDDWDEEEFEKFKFPSTKIKYKAKLVRNELVEVRPLGPPTGLNYCNFKYDYNI